MSKKLSKLAVIILFIFVYGCAGSYKKVNYINESINQSKSGYKIAFMDDTIPIKYSSEPDGIYGMITDTNKKINICISDIYLKEKLVLQPNEIYNWYLFPKWSPDGNKLAFIGVTYRLSEQQEFTYDVGVFIADQDGSNITLIFSSKDISTPYFYAFYEGVVWSDDSTRLLFLSPEASDKSSKYRIILVKGLSVVIESKYGLKDQSDFQYDRPFTEMSPDRKWEIIVSPGKKVPLNPIDYFHSKKARSRLHLPYLTLESEATYLKSSKEAARKKIWPYGIKTQWTPDSEYIVGFTYPHQSSNSNQCFIANLQGELMMFKGSYPDVQYINE